MNRATVTNDMENKGFENGIKKLMDGAEALPSDFVWSGIESDLIAAENILMRSSIATYRRIAAVAIIFAIAASGLSLYYWRTSTAKEIAGQASGAREHQQQKSVPSLDAEQNKVTIVDPSQEFSGQGSDLKNKKGVDESHSLPKQGAALAFETASPQIQRGGNNKSDVSNESFQPVGVSLPFFKPANIEDTPGFLSFEENERALLKQGIAKINDPTLSHADLLLATATVTDEKKSTDNSVIIDEARIPDNDETIIPSEKKILSKETLWASVGVSSGSYIPNTQSTAVMSPGLAAFASTGSSSKPVPNGTSYTLGASIASRILPRWVIQGGVGYLNQTISYESTNPVSSNLQPNFSKAGAFQPTLLNATSVEQGQLTSTQEFVSVPVQAGYLLLEKRIGLQMNAGVASNIFVRNGVTDPAGNGQNGAVLRAESSYRPVSWAGLMSTELSYRLARQYRFSLVPGVRYAINSALKGGVDRPYVLDIGVRFRYIFY